MVLQDQNQPPYPIDQLGISLDGGGGGGDGVSLFTDLSLATPRLISGISKSTRKQIREKRPLLEANPTKTMSSGNCNSNGNRKEPGLELNLKLNLNMLPGRAHEDPVSPHGSIESGSSTSSCVSSELSEDEVGSIMVVAGCRRCLMYVMMSEDDTNCPRCNSSVLLYVGKRPSAAAAATAMDAPATAPAKPN